MRRILISLACALASTRSVPARAEPVEGGAESGPPALLAIEVHHDTRERDGFPASLRLRWSGPRTLIGTDARPDETQLLGARLTCDLGSSWQIAAEFYPLVSEGGDEVTLGSGYPIDLRIAVTARF